MKRKITSTKTIFKYERSECPVCMENMRVESRSVTSPCMHEFCLECIGKWLTESSSTLCPLCKQSVRIIIYDIQTPKKYSKISFPSGFHDAWMLRNKTKNILDNFENIILKIYDAIRNLLFGKKTVFHTKIIDYLFYFGNIMSRLKSGEEKLICEKTEDCITPLTTLEDTECWSLVCQMVKSRLEWLFSPSQSAKIIREIIEKKCTTVKKLINFLNKYVDPIRLNCLKVEIETFLHTANDKSVYVEYYVPGNHKHIIYSKDNLLDSNIGAAIITRIITTINIEMFNMSVAGYQINNINTIYGLLGYLTSCDSILTNLTSASYYILLSTDFYTDSCLKKCVPFMNPITAATRNLIKHCFREEEMSHITQTLKKFEEKYIFFEPLVVDDSSLSEFDFDDYQPDIFIELSDSDDDALQIISVNRPVFDLTECASSDDDQVTDVAMDEYDPVVKKQKPTYSVPEEKSPSPNSNDSNVVKYFEINPNCSFCEPTTSSSELMKPESVTLCHLSDIIDNNVLSVSSDLDQSDGSFHYAGSSPGNNDDNDVHFIYQPRSPNDFYEYLMPKNLPSNNN